MKENYNFKENVIRKCKKLFRKKMIMKSLKRGRRIKKYNRFRKLKIICRKYKDIQMRYLKYLPRQEWLL
jgi:hypothetical protein